MLLKTRIRTVLLFFTVVHVFLFATIKTSGQGIAPEQNYAINSPGVVMVQAVFSATVYVNKVVMNEKRFMQLIDSVKSLDTTGRILSSKEKLDIVVKALYNNPIRYLSASTAYFRQQHRILSSGTGFFITGDGYLITNAHILDRDSAFIRQKFILSTFQEVTDDNINSLQSSWEVLLTDEQRNLISNAYSVIYSQVSSMILFDLKKELYVLFKADNGGGQPVQKRLPAKVVIKGKAMPGKDIAVLKVDSVSEMPTVSLSLNRFARIGEQVFVYGYPEPVTANAFLAQETNIYPTLTVGVISAIKQSIGGWPVLQMDAVISHGSSGSPVCDKKGGVIGLATFGTLEQNTGSLATGYNFAIPISIVKEFLDSANVKPLMSRASLAYNEGLDLVYREYYYRALEKLEKVKELNKEYPQLTYYISLCREQIELGQDRGSFTQRRVFKIMALVFIVLGLVVFFRWQQKRHKGS